MQSPTCFYTNKWKSFTFSSAPSRSPSADARRHSGRITFILFSDHFFFCFGSCLVSKVSGKELARCEASVWARKRRNVRLFACLYVRISGRRNKVRYLLLFLIKTSKEKEEEGEVKEEFWGTQNSSREPFWTFCWEKGNSTGQFKSHYPTAMSVQVCNCSGKTFSLGRNFLSLRVKRSFSCHGVILLFYFLWFLKSQ